MNRGRLKFSVNVFSRGYSLFINSKTHEKNHNELRFKNLVDAFYDIKGFPVECGPSNGHLLWFYFTVLFVTGKKNLAPLSQPIRSKTKTRYALLARVFPLLTPVTCICFVF